MNLPRIWWIAIAAVAITGTAAALFEWMRLNPADRVYRIGWEDDPPVQVVAEKGEPTGLAIEIVREAARRRAIRLQWIRRTESSEEALRSRAVDLWPLMTITEERRKHIYFSQPYQQNEPIFIVSATSAIKGPGDLARSRVSYHRIPYNTQVLQQHFPEMLLRPAASKEAAFQALCSGQSDAIFVERQDATSILLEGSPCPGTALRMLSSGLGGATMAVASTYESRAAADAIRDEIDVMADEDVLGGIFSRWGYATGQDLESLSSLLNARRRLRQYRFGMAALVLLLSFAIWVALAYRRERNRSRMSDRARLQAEQSLRLVTDNLSEMVMAFDMQRRLTYANPGVERLTGYAPAEIRAQGFICWIHPEDRPRMLGYWDRLFEGESYEQEEYRLTTKDGREKWASATWGPIFDQSGIQVGVHGSERDITERKQAERALKESEQRYRDVAHSTADLVFEVDADLRFTYTSARVFEVLGYLPEELLGKQAFHLNDTSEKPGVGEHLARLLRSRQPLRDFEHRARHKDGRYLCMVSSAVPVFDASGEISGIRGVCRDVTQSKQAEQERIRLAEELQQAQKMEAIGRLAGGVAHDFNNLLTVINGYSNMLERRFKPGEPEHEWSTQIAKAGDRAAGLVQQLLTFSRKQFTEPRVLSVNELLGNLEKMLVRLVGEDIELATRLGPGVGSVRADPNQLEQVILNMVVNARDAMPDGGRLTLETDHVELGGCCAECGSRVTAGTYVRLAVGDTGTGMDGETRRRIFEPFFTTKGLGKGTGLGLSIVHGVVVQNGGHIDVESAPGKGTIFRLYLPRIPDEPVAGPFENVGAATGGTGTILVVEDQPDVRAFAVAALRTAGYRILEAAGGDEALTVSGDEAGPINLLLTDVVMPRMSGRELAGRLVVHRPELKVLYMSGYSNSAIEQSGLAEGNLDFIQKPFLSHELVSKVGGVLGSPGEQSRMPGGRGHI